MLICLPVPETLSPLSSNCHLLSSKESRLPAATKAAQNGAAATDAALTQFTESVAAAFSETSTVAGDMNAALGNRATGTVRPRVGR